MHLMSKEKKELQKGRIGRIGHAASCTSIAENSLKGVIGIKAQIIASKDYSQLNMLSHHDVTEARRLSDLLEEQHF